MAPPGYVPPPENSVAAGYLPIENVDLQKHPKFGEIDKDIESFSTNEEKALRDLSHYLKSALHAPDEDAGREILLNSLSPELLGKESVLDHSRFFYLLRNLMTVLGFIVRIGT